MTAGLMRNAVRRRTSNGLGVRPSAACPHALHIVTVIPAAYRRRRQLYPSGPAAGCLRSSVPVSLPQLRQRDAAAKEEVVSGSGPRQSGR